MTIPAFHKDFKVWLKQAPTWVKIMACGRCTGQALRLAFRAGQRSVLNKPFKMMGVK